MFSNTMGIPQSTPKPPLVICIWIALPDPVEYVPALQRLQSKAPAGKQYAMNPCYMSAASCHSTITMTYSQQRINGTPFYPSVCISVSISLSLFLSPFSVIYLSIYLNA